MENKLTPEQRARLEAARVRRQELQKQAENLATSSILAFISRVIGPIVKDVVHGVIDWFASLFR